MTQDDATPLEATESKGRAKRDELTELGEEQLTYVAAGLVFTFKLVAVKTISWG